MEVKCNSYDLLEGSMPLGSVLEGLVLFIHSPPSLSPSLLSLSPPPLPSPSFIFLFLYIFFSPPFSDSHNGINFCLPCRLIVFSLTKAQSNEAKKPDHL